MNLAARDGQIAGAYKPGAGALLLAAAAILTALGFEHLGGVVPCPLCLEERYAYYAGVPALFVALTALSSGRRWSASALFLLVTLAFLANAALGAYHAGAEWQFWPGPAECSSAQPLAKNAGSLLDSVAKTHVVRCDTAAGYFLGLSFAGWNVLGSLAIMILAASAARGALCSPQR